MSRNLCVLFCILQIVYFVHGNGLYSVVGPGSIRSNYKYNVAVSLHKADEPCQIKVSITGPSYNESKTVEVAPKSTQTVEFDVPKLASGDYNLTATGVTGITFENSTRLNYAENKPTIYLQTDKATYKPGDLVQFRVLFLDPNTRPANIEQPIDIVISDGAQNRIKQFKNVHLTKGVYTGELQLSEQPVLGNWLIQVVLGDENVESKSFEVDKYVLPKFDVSIETAKDVAIPDGVIKLTVRSKYTYGKAVKGKATISIKPSYHYYGGSDDMQAEKTIDVDGKGHAEFDLIKDLRISAERSYVPPLKILAVMEEELTGNKQNTTTTVSLHADRYRIEGVDAPYTYVAGEPIIYRVVVKHLDGAPVQDIKTPVVMKLESPRSYFSRGFVAEGDAESTPQNEVLEFTSNLDEHGMAVFKFTLPKNNSTFYSVKCKFAETTAYLSSLSEFTPSLDTPELLKLVVNTKKPRLRDEVEVEVKSSEPIPYLVYVIVARGNILKTEQVSLPENEKSYIIKLTPSFEMIPKAKLFVHYVINDNLRFEELTIDFEKDFQNSIDIDAPVQAKPGEDVKLKIKTDPDSYVGLLGVDQSVLLLKSGNDLKKDDIFNGLSNFAANTPWIRGFGRYPGIQSGLVTMTNAHYPYNDVEFDVSQVQEEYLEVAFEDSEAATADEVDSIDRFDSESTSTQTDTVNTLNVRKEFAESWIWQQYQHPDNTSNRPFYSSVGIGSLIPRPGPPGPSRPGPPGPLSVPGVASGFGGGFGGNGPVIEPPQIRKEFPENWIFQNIENSDGTEFTFAKKIPDTITSWVVTGFSLNPNTGIALTDAPAKIQVFQPFFVSTNLPYSVKRGEVIAIPVIIFNYMDKNLDAEVTMDNSDKEFEFTEATNEVEENPLDEVKRVKRVSVPSNTGKSISFMIRPKKVGQTTLKITATSPLAGDAIHQMLKVEPEGVTQFENRAVFINLKDGAQEQTGKINIDIPAEAVPDSEYIEFSVVGDLLGPTIKNLDKLVRMPYGCGEQNMVNFVPNILVLKYLETIGQSKPTITEKAKKFLEIGYQRELTYKHDDGSYSAFGKSDKAGSTWLTAYVVRSFHQAAKYTDIQPEIIVQGLDFLASKQAENGSFPEYGKLFDSAHQNELGLTAFVLLAFLENVELIPKYQSQIDKAVEFILENAEKSDDQYALAIAVLALQKAKNPLAEKILAKLQGQAKIENDLKWWSKAPDTEPKLQTWRPRSNDVEITSYVLLALLEKETAETALPIVKWLISQRNSNGGFSSTQDTVVGLQALIKFAESTGSGAADVNIDFVGTGPDAAEEKGSIKVNSENSLVLQTHVLPKTTRDVAYTAKGKGSSMVQLSYRYNLAEKDKKPSFQVKTNVKDDTPPQQLVLEVCAEYVPLEAAENDKKESNMAVLEVALPSGYTANVDSFDKIEAVDHVKRTETKNSDSTVIVYFDGLPVGDSKCVPVEASKTHAVAKQKPAAVSIYDYYDTGRRATEYYEVKSSLCDICESDDCGAGCKK